MINNENVNLPCQKNNSYSIIIDSKSCPSNFKGNSRHFFTKIIKPEPATMKTVEKYADVEDKVLQKISKKAREANIDVEVCFKQFDVLNNGFIAPTDFYFLMIQTFELTGDEVTELIFRCDRLKDGRIRYQEIIKEISAKLPLPFQKIRENSANFLDLCKKKDRLIEGAIGLEGFKDVLRQIGLNGDEIEAAAKDAAKNNKGKVLYLEFYDKIA